MHCFSCHCCQMCFAADKLSGFLLIQHLIKTKDNRRHGRSLERETRPDGIEYLQSQECVVSLCSLSFNVKAQTFTKRSRDVMTWLETSPDR